MDMAKVSQSTGQIFASGGSKVLDDESDDIMESSDNEEYTIENSGEQYLPSSTMLKNIREAGPINPAKNTLSGLM